MILNIDQVVESAAEMLSLTESEKENENEKLTACFKAVNEEICREYFPLIAKGKTALDGRTVTLSGLKGEVIRVYAVEEVRGEYSRKLPFKSRGGIVELTGSEIPGGEIYITYSYVPEFGEDDTENLAGARTSALGVCAEYCIIENRLEEAALWDKRYRDSLRRQGGGSVRLKSRRWL